MIPAKSFQHVWLNGRFLDGDQVCLSLSDRGFTLGDGLFETMLWDGQAVRFFNDHMARLKHAADALEIELPQSVDAIHAGLIGLAEAANGQKAALRLTLSRGIGPRGLAFPAMGSSQLLATIVSYNPPVSHVHLKSVSICRNSSAPSALFKTLSYIDNVMAARQARQLGGDDALMLGTSGNLACASSANIIIRDRGASLTPAREDGALPGIVRGRLIKAGLVEEARICLTQLETWQGAALTNALIGVRMISQINDHVFDGSSQWTLKLIAALDDGV